MKVWAKTDGPVREGKYLVVRRDGTIPVWPHFVIAAADPSAGAALRAYAVSAQQRGLDDDYVQSILELAFDFDRYATEFARRAKDGEHKGADPDKGPHRIDNAAIIEMMRGNGDLASYRPDGVGGEDVKPVGWRITNHDGTQFYASPENVEYWTDLHKMVGEPLFLARLPALSVEGEHQKATIQCPKCGNPDSQMCDCSLPSGCAETFQARVRPWMMDCFGPTISGDKLERNDRFLEEALELVQASGYMAERAHALVEYTFNRPQGDINQEVGGVMVTLAAHCLAHGVDMHEAGETELARINQPDMIVKIRAKQATKPKHSPLPIPDPQPQVTEDDLAWLEWIFSRGPWQPRFVGVPDSERKDRILSTLNKKGTDK